MVILYFLYAGALGLWTYYSIPHCQAGVAENYRNLVLVLCIMGLLVSLMWREKKVLRYGMMIMLMLLNIGGSIAYRMDWQMVQNECDDVNVFNSYYKDLAYMFFAFIIIYLLICYLKFHEIQFLNLLCMLALPVVLILTRFTSEEVNDSYLFLFNHFHIFGVVLMGYPFVMAYFMSRPERYYFKGNVKNLSYNLIGLLLYDFLLFIGCGICNEFGLLLIIALITTVMFFIRCKNVITKLAYSGACLGGALLVSSISARVNERVQIWLNLKAAAGNEKLMEKAETVLYLFRNVEHMGWWGNGIGNLPRVKFKTLNTDHVLVTLMNDYGCLMAILTILLGALLVKWMLGERRQLNAYNKYLNLTCALVVGFMVLIHIASNLGSFLTAGIGYPWCSEGSAINIMLTILVAIHCGIVNKKEVQSDEMEER